MAKKRNHPEHGDEALKFGQSLMVPLSVSGGWAVRGTREEPSQKVTPRKRNLTMSEVFRLLYGGKKTRSED